ncbi:MAG TPA: hypothetical protein VGO11_14480 [Chthoniobacteraceae bacterium]|jgi:hypothetical protein|nr:hypothetical protein [Chthoniobacteraceae bacterium]
MLSTSRSPRSLILFSLSMLLLAASLDAVMDKLQFHYDRSVFAPMKAHRQWLDPRLSWRNKWRNGDARQGEAFPLSSTSLVGLTDAWHCAKSLWIACILLAILAPFTALVRLRWWAWVLVFFGAEVVYGGWFELLFSRVLTR